MKSQPFKSGFYILLLLLLLYAISGMMSCGSGNDKIYSPDAESLNSHPLPEWFNDAKFGIFIHWGPYSVPAYGNTEFGVPLSYAEWYWYIQMLFPSLSTGKHHLETYGPDVVYDDFIEMWKAEQFDAKELVDLIQSAGAKYAVLVSKHHDGVALWDSRATGRDTVDLGPGRDFVREYTDAMKDAGLKSGLYYSLFEWFHPDYPANEGKHYLTPDFPLPKLDLINPYTREPVDYTGYDKPVDDYVDEHMLPQIRELIDSYDPDMLWFDGDWDLPGSYWRLPEVVAEYYNQAADRKKPKQVIVNDRVGDGLDWDGDFRTFEYKSEFSLSDKAWEATRGIGKSFGYNAQESEEDYLDSNELIDMLVDIVSKNGNLLLNIGPRADGTVIDLMKDRLSQMGKWLKVNGEAIYGSRPWERYGEGTLRFTTREDFFYIIALEKPDGELRVNLEVADGSIITMLGMDMPLAYSTEDSVLIIQIPDDKPLPGDYAWTFRIAPPL